MTEDVVVLYRPTGPKELELVAASGYRRWPPRLPEQPTFYPVTNEEYAKEIAIKWNVPASGVGYVERISKMVNCGLNPCRERTDGCQRRTMGSGGTFTSESSSPGRWQRATQSR